MAENSDLTKEDHIKYAKHKAGCGCSFCVYYERRRAEMRMKELGWK